MIIFEPEEQNEIKGRGMVFVGPYPVSWSRDQFHGTMIQMNNEKYYVESIEWWCIPREPKMGENVGLLLKSAA